MSVVDSCVLCDARMKGLRWRRAGFHRWASLDCGNGKRHSAANPRTTLRTAAFMDLGRKAKTTLCRMSHLEDTWCNIAEGRARGAIWMKKLTLQMRRSISPATLRVNGNVEKLAFKTAQSRHEVSANETRRRIEPTAQKMPLIGIVTGVLREHPGAPPFHTSPAGQTKNVPGIFGRRRRGRSLSSLIRFPTYSP